MDLRPIPIMLQDDGMALWVRRETEDCLFTYKRRSARESCGFSTFFDLHKRVFSMVFSKDVMNAVSSLFVF